MLFLTPRLAARLCERRRERGRPEGRGEGQVGTLYGRTACFWGGEKWLYGRTVCFGEGEKWLYGRTACFWEGEKWLYGRTACFWEGEKWLYGRTACFWEGEKWLYGRTACFGEGEKWLYGRLLRGGSVDGGLGWGILGFFGRFGVAKSGVAFGSFFGGIAVKEAACFAGFCIGLLEEGEDAIADQECLFLFVEENDVEDIKGGLFGAFDILMGDLATSLNIGPIVEEECGEALEIFGEIAESRAFADLFESLFDVGIVAPNIISGVE